MIAILSDIHSNWIALRAVLADIETRGCSEIICLGDVIGYGPQPVECLTTARERFAVTLCGNHELAILQGPFGFRRVAREAIEWHRRILRPHWYSSQERKANWTFLENLPRRHERGRFLFVHASPSDPIEEYLLPEDVDPSAGPSPRLQRAFANVEWVAFTGHTHQPGVFTLEPPRFHKPAELREASYYLRPATKAIINVGSVGQPRDGDPRACYVTLHEGVVTYHRVPYDTKATAAKVLQTRALDDSLGRRLLDGS